MIKSLTIMENVKLQPKPLRMQCLASLEKQMTNLQKCICFKKTLKHHQMQMSLKIIKLLQSK